MGLIARTVETAGIPTLSMTSAWSITRAVNPPRAVYLDFPLGHTTGKPNDPAGQRSILADALRHFETIGEPGTIETLPYPWDDDDAWKDRVMRPAPGRDTSRPSAWTDDRVERHDTPQYQYDRDRAVAEEALRGDGCRTCVFLPEDAPSAG